MRLPEDTPFGLVAPVETYVDWDGPKLFSALSSRGDLLLVMWIEDTEDLTRWWYCPLTRPQLEAIRSGDLGPASAVREAPTLYLVESPRQGATLVQVMSGASAPAEDLPLPGDTLRVEEDLSEHLRVADQQLVALATNQEVHDLRLVGESVADHRIPFETLATLLRRWVLFAREHAKSLDKLFQFEVYAFSPGSFVVRSTGGASSRHLLAGAMTALEVGSPSQIKQAIPSWDARRALRRLLDGLSEAELELSSSAIDPSGRSSHAFLSHGRISFLREAYGSGDHESTPVTLKGVLDSASRPGRQFTLISGTLGVVTVDVAAELADSLDSLRIGRTVEAEATRHSIRNRFGDEIEVAYSLSESLARKRAGDAVSDGTVRLEPESALPDFVPVYRRESIKARWAKRLSRTDAFAYEGAVAYLRLTQSGNRIPNPGTWFRDVLFGSHLEWRLGRWGRVSRAVAELAWIDAVVSIPGHRHQLRKVLVSHDSDRYRLDNFPATWLHWSNQVVDQIARAALTGTWITLERDSDDIVWITMGVDKPNWHGSRPL